jgi:carbamoyl-phosphate synthase small subunit
MLYRDERPAILMLQDGRYFQGIGFGASKVVTGELVFTTITGAGYNETLTDSSYQGQIVVMTHPLVGNYGVPPFERDEFGITKYFESDSSPNIEELKEIVANAEDPNLRDLASEVSTTEVKIYKPLNPIGKVVVLDMGVKLNIIRNLIVRNLEVIVVPYIYTYTQIMAFNPDGVFVSNGPGDPAIYKGAIEVCTKLIENNIPTMGICMGNLIIALAAGGTSYKLKYGHRGGNKTVIDTGNQRCYITTQNHGFCVKDFEKGGFRENLRNIDDGSNEGIIHESKPIFAVQFHPEACPGPLDSLYLFDKFVDYMRRT